MILGIDEMGHRVDTGVAVISTHPIFTIEPPSSQQGSTCNPHTEDLIAKDLNLKTIPLRLPLAMVLALAGHLVQAQPSSSEDGQRPPRGGPPAEAIAACKGKASGASCSFTGRQNETVSGSCDSPPGPPPGSSNSSSSSSSSTASVLACRPSGPPPQR